MANAAANHIRLEYEAVRSSDRRPLLLIAALSDRLIHWDDEFCGSLAQTTHDVIRFENRDTGL